MQVSEVARKIGLFKSLLRHMLSLLFWWLRIRPTEPTKSKGVHGKGIDAPLSLLLDAARSLFLF
jgi:hypothetical protein